MSSRSLNKVILIGNLTRDPELKYTPNSTAVCTFSVATNRTWVTGDGQTKEDVQFHRIVAWQKLAELCAKLLTKGKKVYLEGRLVYRKITGKDGNERDITEIVMDDFIVMSAPTGAKSEKEEDKTPEKEDTFDDIPEELPKEKGKEEKINDDDIPF